MKKVKLEYIFFLLYKLGSKQEKVWAEYYAAVMISFFAAVSLYVINFRIVIVCKVFNKEFFLAKPYLYAMCLFFFFAICFFKFIYKKRYVGIENKYDSEWLSLTTKQRRVLLVKNLWPTIVMMAFGLLGVFVLRYLNGHGFW